MELITLENAGIEFIDGDRGKNYPKIDEFKEQGYCLFLSAKNVTNKGFLFDEKLFISQEKDGLLRKGKLSRGDIVITTRGTVGNVALYNDIVPFDNIRINSGMVILRCNQQKYSTVFLDIVFRSEFFQNQIKGLVSGSAVPQLPIKDLKNLKMPNLSLENQKKVIDMVGRLENKIQLNTQINQTLEQIAQTIFKSWFIDFDPVHAKANALASGQAAEQATQAAMAVISGKNTQELHRLQTANPEQYQQLWEIAEAFPSGVDEEGVPRGWGQTTLSEVCSMKNGYAFKSSDWTDEGIPVIKIGSVKPMIVEVDGNGFVDEEHSVLHSEFLLTEGDIVVGLTGYVGEVGRIPQGRTAMLNQRVAKFIPNKLNEQQDYYSFVYCLVRDKSFKAFAETNAKGSAQANISTKELLNYSIILASSEIQMKFESLIKPLLDKILVNSGNNENLSKVRDLLLPKLLSGEIHL
ncbi:restriction endonuclease subunit S [Glaesserella parasuis]|nr:restriction endonuclease subunit S [Glaesserella parasuis]